MEKLKALPIVTEYWTPGEDWLQQIIQNVKGRIAHGDIIVVSEKAISTAMGNLSDEATVEAGRAARLIAKYWMRWVWGCVLGRFCHFRERLLYYLRTYPIEKGSRHKHFVLRHFGILQALMFGSEGGMDGSNLAYSYMCMPLDDPGRVANQIRRRIRLNLEKEITVIIVDTDRTYSFRNLHFTPRPRSLRGIHSLGGFVTYVLGNALRLRKHPTPIALSGSEISVKEALRIAKLANRVRGHGAGKTVWDMAEKFAVELNGVTWEMLKRVKHKPIVVIRVSRL